MGLREEALSDERDLFIIIQVLCHTAIRKGYVAKTLLNGRDPIIFAHSVCSLFTQETYIVEIDSMGE